MKSRTLLFTLLFLIILAGCAAKSSSLLTDVSNLSLNGLTFNEAPEDGFKFIVFAHAYGDPADLDDMPSSTLISHLPELNSLGVDMMFSLGDMTRKAELQQVKNLEKYIISEINVPVFNAVGNHDVTNRIFYEQYFGETYYHFTYGNSMFLVLDTEIDSCSILGDQQEMLKAQLENALADDSIENVFIMMHKVLFLNSEIIAEGSNMFARPNDYEIFVGNNFEDILSDIIKPYAAHKSVYMFAGDVGAFDGNLSPFYYKYPGLPMYSYAAGIGDSQEDVVFVVSVDGKKISVDPLRLGDNTYLNIKKYSLAYWENYGQGPFISIAKIKTNAVECAIGVCRFAKNTFNIRCRYFYFLLALIVIVLFGILFKFGIKIKKKID